MNKKSNSQPKNPGSGYNRYRGEELPPSDTHPVSQPQPMDNTSGTAHGSKNVVTGKDPADDRQSFDDLLKGLNASVAEGMGRAPSCKAFNAVVNKRDGGRPKPK